LIPYLKELWSRRALAVLSTFLAAAIAVLAVFQVSLAPPSISKRNHVDAKGSIEILVDSARSPIADARRDLTGLTARAGVFARLMAGGDVVGRIAKANQIPVKQIDVAGPAPLPGEAPGVGEAPLQIHPYGIAIAQAQELPILSVETRAPTVAVARSLAAAAPDALRHVIRSIQAQQGTPAAKRVEVRVLGPPEAALKDDAQGKKVALVLFVVLLVVFLMLILGIPRLVTAWHADGRGADLGGGADEVPQAPEILHLPAGRGEEPDGGDLGAASIGQES